MESTQEQQPSPKKQKLAEEFKEKAEKVIAKLDEKKKTPITPLDFPEFKEKVTDMTANTIKAIQESNLPLDVKNRTINNTVTSTLIWAMLQETLTANLDGKLSDLVDIIKNLP